MCPLIREETEPVSPFYFVTSKYYTCRTTLAKNRKENTEVV